MAGKKISVALLFGLIAGTCMILFDTGNYFSGPAAFVGRGVYLVYMIPLVLAVRAVMLQKKKNGGWLRFQEAVKCCFTIFVIGLGLHVLFVWWLTNVGDPHFKQLLLPEIAANSEKAYKRFGMPEDQIRQTMEAQKNEDPFSLVSLVKGLAYYYIVYFFIALLIAAVVKRKKEPAGNPGK